MLTVKSVDKHSVGNEIGIISGDKILAFDGHKVVDILDYLYYDEQEFFVMTVEHKGEVCDYEVEKYEDESLGLTFEDDNLAIEKCRNDCIFCFVSQMPNGMRDSLYVKDDDYRQSFLCGNYVTLTNVSDEDIERIIRLNLSPIYVSVQVTDGETRKKMLNNRFADKIMAQLRRLSSAGIAIHTQIVLVKGVNDGKLLDKSLEDLSTLEMVKSIAVVPCGITKYREGLFPIEDIDKLYAKDIIEKVRAFNEKVGKTLCFAADDFYIKAEQPCEPYEFYGEFDQLENGVGMLAKFEHDFNEVARKTAYSRTFLLVTGVAVKGLMEKYAKKTEEYCDGLKIHVLAVTNKFFGETVTCTGLLTGQDVIESVLKFDKNYDEIVISDVMLKDNYLFLDDITISKVEEKTGKKVRIIEGGGDNFFEALTKGGQNE